MQKPAESERNTGDTELAWRVLGLLHNLDYDRVKEPERHCLEAAKVFKEEGMHPAGIHAIAAHNDDGLKATGIRCLGAMDHAVSCAEAVVGLVHATSQILPSKDVRDLELKSLVKRFHDRKFAANVERPLILRCAGLGLPLVKRIVEAHDGQISVATAPDQGTTVMLFLPFRADEGLTIETQRNDES